MPPSTPKLLTQITLSRPYFSAIWVTVFGVAEVVTDNKIQPCVSFHLIRTFPPQRGHQPAGPFLPLAQRKQPGGKLIDAWATESDWDPSSLVSNTFRMEWPKGSGLIQVFPEIDRAEWFDMAEAMSRILPGQRGFLDELLQKLVC